ncbi:MAG TPA: caspase family protein [Saprospiraceae bacterium]
MIRSVISATFLCFLFTISFAQCLSGDCQTGMSKYRFKNGALYEGEMSYGKIHGLGTLKFANGDVYKGYWKMNKREGEGILNSVDGYSYQGTFANNKLHGIGRVYDISGGYFEGVWEAGVNTSGGVYVFSDGRKEKGYWTESGFKVNKETPVTTQIEIIADCNLVPCGSGKGRMVFDDGSVYTGFFLNGLPDGEGECRYVNGEVYKGRWSNGRPSGKGRYSYSNGVVLNGEWRDGKYIDTKPVVKSSYAEGVNIYALIVGASRYDHFESLKYTDDDAYRIYAFLKSPEGGAVPEDHIRILIDESAIAENIFKGLDDIIAMAGKDDVVLVYLAGHGLQGFYVPTDSDGYRNRVEYEDIKSRLSLCQARQKLVIADACYSGSLLAAKSPMFESVDLFYKKLLSSGAGTAFLLSSKSEEFSLESQGLRQGIFSHYLVEGLKGQADTNKDKLVSLEELYSFVYSHVREYSGNLQTPVLAGDIDMGMPLASVR